MDFNAVLAQLNDLPSAFTRSGAPYTWLAASAAAQDALSTEGTDDTLLQVQNFNNAQDGWLDVFGLLFNIPRNPDEANSPYMTRIAETVLAWVATPQAMIFWINLFAPGGTFTETGLGYKITLPSWMSPLQVAGFIASLNRIRPVGVPFTLAQINGGLYMGTSEFMGAGGAVMGDYLAAGNSPINIPLGATTLSAQPLLPGLLLIDPTLNPSLAPAGGAS